MEASAQMYKITKDVRNRIVHVILSGFLVPEEVEAFACEEQKAVRDMGCTSGNYHVLVDTRDLKLQAQNVIARLVEFSESSPLKAAKIAIVVGNSVSRMQARGWVGATRVGIFSTDKEATAWLLNSGTDSLAAAS
jgi:hypothetical protein